ncbi:MAG: peptidoglycan DD-metalloendopeptidase family protein, partial [Pseudomonadota bacterium]
RDFALARSAALSDAMQTLEAQKDAVQAQQSALVTDLQAFAASGIDGLERMFGAAQIDVERLTSEVAQNYSGQGGPFEALTLASIDQATPEDGRLGTLMSDLERLSLMHFAAERVPFAKPVQGARLTSGFGPRRDPFHRRYSMHNGIDYAGPRGTAILATASGVVTFVGRQRGYGKVIEIRHAFGFETLYAHLHKTRVRLGQRVEKGDRIGDMGNTGRSTGVHVHYEVRLNDRPVNPMTFIEAARDVL